MLVAGGDVNLGRECGQAILADPRYDPFRFMAPIWGDADLRFVNLESQLSDQHGETQSPRNRLIFTGPPAGAETLSQAGIAVVSTANNHAWDYGRGAFFETLDNLARANVKSAGTGRTLERAYEPVLFDGARDACRRRWRSRRSGTPDPSSSTKAETTWLGHVSIVYARPFRVLGTRRTTSSCRTTGVSSTSTRRPIRRGTSSTASLKTGLVDVVIGHHPHVPQGVGFRDGHPVFYSLGNFVFAGHDWAPWTLFGFLARLELGAERRAARSAPVRSRSTVTCRRRCRPPIRVRRNSAST